MGDRRAAPRFIAWALVLAGACGDSGGGGDGGDRDGGGGRDGGGPTACDPACGPGQRCAGGTCMDVGPARACGCTAADAGPGEVCHEAYGVFDAADSIVFVDGSAAMDGDGTLASPFRRIDLALQAVSMMPAGGTVAVAAGTYAGDLVIAPSRNVRLSGACAEDVRIAGRISVESPTAPASIVIDGVTVAPAGFSIDPLDGWGACTDPVEPRGVSISTGAIAVHVELRDAVVAGWCTGVYFNADPAGGSGLCVYRSRVCANEQGVVLQGGPQGSPQAGACQDLGYGSVVRSTLIDQNRLYGLYADQGSRAVGLVGSFFDATGTVGARSTEVAAGQGIGVYLGNLVEGLIEDNAAAGNLGAGLALRNLDRGAFEIEIRSNTLLGNAGAGITLQELQATTPVVIAGNRVEGTTAGPGGEGGDGIQVLVAGGTSYSVMMEGNTVGASSRDGILLGGVSGSVTGNTVTGSGQFGILLQASDAVATGNTVGGSGTEDVRDSDTALHDGVSLPIPEP